MQIKNTKIASPKAKPATKAAKPAAPAGGDQKRKTLQDNVGMSPPKTKVPTGPKISESRLDSAELEAALAKAAEATPLQNRAKPTDKNLNSEILDSATISREGIEARVPDKTPSFIQLFEEQNKF